MWRLFGSTPDTALPQGVTTGSTSARMFGAKESAKLNFTLPNQASAGILNHILWHAIKGARSPYPGPQPFGIPKMPTASQYVWGSLGTKADPLLSAHGVPHLQVRYAQTLTDKSSAHR